jgi:hypothetical protein
MGSDAVFGEFACWVLALGCCKACKLIGKVQAGCSVGHCWAKKYAATLEQVQPLSCSNTCSSNVGHATSPVCITALGCLLCTSRHSSSPAMQLLVRPFMGHVSSLCDSIGLPSRAQALFPHALGLLLKGRPMCSITCVSNGMPYTGTGDFLCPVNGALSQRGSYSKGYTHAHAVLFMPGTLGRAGTV